MTQITSNESSFIIDLFDIVQSRFERDRDYAKLQDRGLDWFSSTRHNSADSVPRLYFGGRH